MENKHTTLSELFTAIADAIRQKTGTENPIVADNFPSVIANITVGTQSGTMIHAIEADFGNVPAATEFYLELPDDWSKKAIHGGEVKKIENIFVFSKDTGGGTITFVTPMPLESLFDNRLNASSHYGFTFAIANAKDTVANMFIDKDEQGRTKLKFIAHGQEI